MKPYYEHAGIQIFCGDCREILPQLPGPVMCCVTSPPYWGLRDYGNAGQVGFEGFYLDYVNNLRGIFEEVRRVLHPQGTLWLNLGDSYHNGDKGGYRKGRVGAASRIQKKHLANDFVGAPNRQPQAGLKPKDLVGIPWRVAFSLQDAGWWLRSDIIWNKPNPMPESVNDRPTRSHEYIFLLSKSERYYCDMAAIKERAVSGDARKPYAPGQVDARGNGHNRDGGKVRATCQDNPGLAEWRNRRTVWTINTAASEDDHYATYPEELIQPCIAAGSARHNTILDPFAGAGTTLLCAKRNHCSAIGIEIEEKYCEIAAKRLSQEVFQF